jgi:methylated-DNA-[protein]-cysteine S-methyltransferase
MKQTKIIGENIMNHFSYSILKSPIDDLMLVADASVLTGVYFVGCDHIPAASKHWTLNAQHSVLSQATKQLQEYFAGKRQNFSLPLRLAGTDFQQKVWQEIARIPYGETINYSELAKRAGAPQAIRAAGTTTGRNPVSIIVPCHRVMGKNGSMCGFAGGLERKRYLLSLENSEINPAKNGTPTPIQANANARLRRQETAKLQLSLM